MKVISKILVLAAILIGSQTMASAAETRKLDKPINESDFAIIFQMASIGDDVSLNPQPLPPRLLKRRLHVLLGEGVALNPQPLPPVVITSLTNRNTDFVEKF